MERKVYLLVYTNSVGTRDDIKAWANSCGLVKAWRYDMPNSMYLASEAAAQELSDSLREALPQGRFLITELSRNRQGWLSSETWHLIRTGQLLPATK